MQDKDQQKAKDQPRGHVFDGIFEYDNDLPIWWVALFIITIVFSVFYMAWYHLGVFPSASLEQEYTAAKLQAAAAPIPGGGGGGGPAAESGGEIPAVSDLTADDLSAAQADFKTTCSPCHGLKGEGSIGPNLTDDFWIHEPTLAGVESLITNGAAAQGMPAWGDFLGRKKIRQLVGFIKSIQGSNPSGAKAAQGATGKLQ